jgi:dTMP kinase
LATGKFITFEGGEGVGKSTQASLLTQDLRAKGIDVVLTREPGGVAPAERIRTLLVEGPIECWDPMTEALLHFAARREHVSRLIRPALDAGRWIVCDRFADSTTAYQGYGHGLGRQAIERLHEMVIGDLAPDLTLVLDAPPAQALARARLRAERPAAAGVSAAGSPLDPRRQGNAESRYERMGLAFHERVREGFKDIARLHPERCVLIDASAAVDDVRARVRAVVGTRWEIVW